MAPDSLARSLNGAEFVCCVLTWFLQGAIVLATWSYFFNSERERKDNLWLKSMVGFLFLATSAVALINSVSLYEGFVVYRDVPFYQDARVKAPMPALGALIGTVVHFYFVRRCWKLLNQASWFLFATIPALFFPFPAGVYISNMLYHRTFDIATGSALNGAWYACWLYLDTLASAVLIWRVSSFKKGVPFPSTIAMLQRFMMLSFATCLLLALVQCASLIVYYRVWFSTACPTLQLVNRLQVLTLLAALASRPSNGSIRGDSSGKPSFVSFGSSSAGSRVANRVPPPIYVNNPLGEKQDSYDVELEQQSPACAC